MYNKYAAKDFGTCPLVQCAGQPVLPVGLKDDMGADTVKTYCPKCGQIYHPPPVRGRSGNASGVDGASFGTTFPHLFLMTFHNLVPDPLPMTATYVPRVFGFKVHKSAHGPHPPTPVDRNVEEPAVVVVASQSKKSSDEEEEAALSRRRKRRSDDASKSNSNKEGASGSGGAGNSQGAPPAAFMMDSVKRRRRNNGST